MSRKLTTAILIATVLFFAPIAHAYMFDDPVNMPWPMAGYDRIGDATFEIFGVDVANNAGSTIVDIYTNYPQGGYQVGNWFTKPGDLALDINEDGMFEYGLAFTAHDGLTAGNLYSVSEWYKSNDFAPSPYYIYFKDKIVQIKTGTFFSTQSVSWIDNDLGSDPSIPDWKISLIFNDSLMPGDHNNSTNFFYPVATCSNDYIEGTVTNTPEPATFALLGLGLLGLRRLKLKK